MKALKPVEALNRLVEIVNGYAVSQTFFSACRLGLFEQLSKGPATADDLSERLSIHPNGCRRLLVALAHLGLVEREDGLYRNSEVGNFCTSKSPVPLEPISMMGETFYHMFEYLPDALREFSPRWQQALGTEASEVFAALYEDPARLRRFAQMMNAFSIPQGQEIAEHFDFTPYRCVMDVGGGPGGIAIQIGTLSCVASSWTWLLCARSPKNTFKPMAWPVVSLRQRLIFSRVRIRKVRTS